MIEEDVLETLFDTMDFHNGNADEVLDEMEAYAPDDQYQYIKDNYTDFYSVWNYHRNRRMQEMMYVIETKQDLSGDEVLDYYNHLPANDD